MMPGIRKKRLWRISVYLDLPTLAMDLGVSRSTMYNWANGRHTPAWFKRALHETNIWPLDKWDEAQEDKTSEAIEAIFKQLDTTRLPGPWRGEDSGATQAKPANDNGRPNRGGQDGDDSRAGEEGS